MSSSREHLVAAAPAPKSSSPAQAPSSSSLLFVYLSVLWISPGCSSSSSPPSSGVTPFSSLPSFLSSSWIITVSNFLFLSLYSGHPAAVAAATKPRRRRHSSLGSSRQSSFVHLSRHLLWTPNNPSAIAPSRNFRPSTSSPPRSTFTLSPCSVPALPQRLTVLPLHPPAVLQFFDLSSHHRCNHHLRPLFLPCPLPSQAHIMATVFTSTTDHPAPIHCCHCCRRHLQLPKSSSSSPLFQLKRRAFILALPSLTITQ
ncbi:hypothetical protein M0R45_008772 [Rubus argutus]|uniref:Uncharacterized protein n=1 Tax=Rubus argutus TaxID=59490 RepID=A0AAW1Y4P5_RUBAR